MSVFPRGSFVRAVRFNQLVKTLIVAVVLALSPAQGNCTKIIRVHPDLENLAIQVRAFQTQHGRLPTSEEGLEILVTNKTALPNWRPLLEQMPFDPWGKSYQYVLRPGPTMPSTETPLQSAEFGLFSFGPDRMSATGGNDPDDINSWDPNEEWSDPSSGADWFRIGWVTALGTAWAVLIWKVQTLVRNRRR